MDQERLDRIVKHCIENGGCRRERTSVHSGPTLILAYDACPVYTDGLIIECPYRGTEQKPDPTGNVCRYECLNPDKPKNIGEQSHLDLFGDGRK